jgi:hypothetical protein
MSTTRTQLELFLFDEYGEVIETNDPRHPDFDPTDYQMQEANHLAIAWHDAV